MLALETPFDSFLKDSREDFSTIFNPPEDRAVFIENAEAVRASKLKNEEEKIEIASIITEPLNLKKKKISIETIEFNLDLLSKLKSNDQFKVGVDSYNKLQRYHWKASYWLAWQDYTSSTHDTIRLTYNSAIFILETANNYQKNETLQQLADRIKTVMSAAIQGVRNHGISRKSYWGHEALSNGISSELLSNWEKFKNKTNRSLEHVHDPYPPENPRYLEIEQPPPHPQLDPVPTHLPYAPFSLPAEPPFTNPRATFYFQETSSNGVIELGTDSDSTPADSLTLQSQER